MSPLPPQRCSGANSACGVQGWISLWAQNQDRLASEVGRSAATPGCDLVVDLPTVSSRHCRLTQTAEGFLLEDLKSRNGSFVNGQRVDAPIIVSKKDTITLGRSVPMPWPEPPETIPQHIISIGRASDNNVVLDYPTVSMRHARIVVQGNRTWIEDLKSTNGTAVGSPDRKIQRELLSPSDVVYFGTLRVPAARLLGGELAMGGQPHTEFRVQERATIFGRDVTCDHVLEDPLVSRASRPADACRHDRPRRGSRLRQRHVCQ